MDDSSGAPTVATTRKQRLQLLADPTLVIPTKKARRPNPPSRTRSSEGSVLQDARTRRRPKPTEVNDKFNYLLEFRDSITNFSSHTLTDSEILVLLLGHNFIIQSDRSPPEFKKFELNIIKDL